LQKRGGNGNRKDSQGREEREGTNRYFQSLNIGEFPDLTFVSLNTGHGSERKNLTSQQIKAKDEALDGVVIEKRAFVEQHEKKKERRDKPV